MVSIERIVTIIVLLWVFVYTASYGNWTWKRKNKLGAVMVYVVAIAALVLPVYTIFFRD